MEKPAFAFKDPFTWRDSNDAYKGTIRTVMDTLSRGFGAGSNKLRHIQIVLAEQPDLYGGFQSGLARLHDKYQQQGKGRFGVQAYSYDMKKDIAPTLKSFLVSPPDIAGTLQGLIGVEKDRGDASSYLETVCFLRSAKNSKSVTAGHISDVVKQIDQVSVLAELVGIVAHRTDLLAGIKKDEVVRIGGNVGRDNYEAGAFNKFLAAYQGQDFAAEVAPIASVVVRQRWVPELKS